MPDTPKPPKRLTELAPMRSQDLLDALNRLDPETLQLYFEARSEVATETDKVRFARTALGDDDMLCKLAAVSHGQIVAIESLSYQGGRAGVGNRMIGNAVCPLQAKAVLSAVLEAA